MSNTATAPLMKNEYVQELLSILKEQGGDAGGLLAIMGYVGQMERQLDAAVNQLAAMREELGELREVQSHPVKTALQKAIHSLEKGVNAAKMQLNDVKDSIVSGCKNAAAAFREQGAVALNNLAGFFKIKQGLENVRHTLYACEQANSKRMDKIAAFSAEYHETGRHLKNMGRALLGKETVQEAKPMGRLAKLAQAPSHMMRDTCMGVNRSVTAAIGKLEQMEQTAVKKPSVLGNLQAMKEKAAQAAQDVPKQERPRAQEASI